jgi:hypothetical protein
VVPKVPVDDTPAAAFKRRQPYLEEMLREKLIKDSQEIDIETEEGASKKLLAAHEKLSQPKKREALPAEMAVSEPQLPIVELIARRADLQGLPVRNVSDCTLSASEANSVRAMSLEVQMVRRKNRSGLSSQGSPTSVLIQSELVLRHAELQLKEWQTDVGVRMLEQMFQTGPYPVRHQLLKELDEHKGKVASEALARRAVFDLGSDVREAAVTALKGRPAAEYRPVLLAALRYPWAPVADHAAEALVALRDSEAIPDLLSLLDEPSPQGPTLGKDGKWRAPQLVRVNHLGNCLLCHAPSSGQKDPVRGVVPVRGEPLPQLYHQSHKGTFVRADVTYLRQDFSLMQHVAEPKKWPEMQRFDFLVRQRELSAAEVATCQAAETLASYPQREAVLWALRELTGEDHGDRSEDWR